VPAERDGRDGSRARHVMFALGGPSRAEGLRAVAGLAPEQAVRGRDLAITYRLPAGLAEAAYKTLGAKETGCGVPPVRINRGGTS